MAYIDSVHSAEYYIFNSYSSDQDDLIHNHNLYVIIFIYFYLNMNYLQKHNKLLDDITT